MRKKLFFFFLASLLASTPIVYKAWPIMRDKECYRSFFPKEAFLAKEASPWMNAQIDSDLRPFSEIPLEALDQTFAKTKPIFDRYRIYKNKLYKYAPNGGKISSRDNPFERALKTLLLFKKVPNVDFLYCPMDGLPESYMPKEFYFATPQAPIFAKARLKSAPHIILIPDQFSLSEDWYNVSKEILALNGKIAWKDKKERAMWRGGFTDIGAPNGTMVVHFRECPRFKICKMSEKFVDAGLQWSESKEMDAILAEEGAMKNGASKKEHLQFKYLPVLDGHMCTYPGYQWRLLSDSVAFKQESDQEQWFYSALKPYEHYIPIKNDLSDLLEKIEWAQAHDEEVQKMVRNARDFAQNHLLLEDNYLYLYLALQKYAKKQKIDWKMDDSWISIHYRKQQDLLKSWRRLKNGISVQKSSWATLSSSDFSELAVR